MISNEILKSFVNKNVLITGGTGLIGRQVVDILCEAEARVKIVSLDRLTIHEKATHILGDLTSFDLCKQVTEGIDFVFHLAGIKASAEISEKRIANHFVPTVMMNTNILEACRLNKVQKTVFTSSIGAYPSGDLFREAGYRLDSVPMDFGGWAKRMAELQIHSYKVQYGLENFSVVRPSSVYGPGDNFDPSNAMLIPTLMHRILHRKGPVTIWGDGSAVRDFVYSRDVAEGVIQALYHGTGGGFVNLGSGGGCSIKEVVDALKSFIDFDYEFDTAKSNGYPKRVMDISLAQELIGFTPSTDLGTGLRNTWDWFLSHSEEYKSKMNYFLPERH
jgi:GDP-L-fucose synthase